MYGGSGLDKAMLKRFMLTEADFAADAIEIWPENYPAYQLFGFLSTQWRTSYGGVTGLDYNVLFHKLDRMKLSDDEYAWMEADIRVMESAALDEIQSQKEP